MASSTAGTRGTIDGRCLPTFLLLTRPAAGAPGRDARDCMSTIGLTTHEGRCFPTLRLRGRACWLRNDVPMLARRRCPTDSRLETEALEFFERSVVAACLQETSLCEFPRLARSRCHIEGCEAESHEGLEEGWSRVEPAGALATAALPSFATLAFSRLPADLMALVLPSFARNGGCGAAPAAALIAFAKLSLPVDMPAWTPLELLPLPRFVSPTLVDCELEAKTPNSPWSLSADNREPAEDNEQRFRIISVNWLVVGKVPRCDIRSARLLRRIFPPACTSTVCMSMQP